MYDPHSGIEDKHLIMSCVQKRPEISNGIIPKTLDILSTKTPEMKVIDYADMAKLAPTAGDSMTPLEGWHPHPPTRVLLKVVI